MKFLAETIIEMRRSQIFENHSKGKICSCQGKLIFWLVETIFFSIFQIFLSVTFQQNPSFQLVGTDFRAHNGLHQQKTVNKKYVSNTQITTRISDGFSLLEENFQVKQTVSTREKSFPIFGMKDSLKSKFSMDRVSFTERSLYIRKWFV